MSLKQTATEVLEIIERGYYTVDGANVSIEADVRNSSNGSRLFTPDELSELRKKTPSGAVPVVEVVNGTTQEIARSMAADGPVALLNFASARNTGGGFLNGAKAQEEDLCRCSALYPTLLNHTKYYEINREQSSLLYTDHLIFSPDVPFFKTRGTGDYLAHPFHASVITAPAPNSRPYLANSGDNELLEKCFQRRWSNVFVSAIDCDIKNLLLGAWGCGAFGGDPYMASRTAKKAINDYGAAFDRIVFAIPGKGKQSKHNLTVFSETLSD